MMPSLLSTNIVGAQHTSYSTDAILNELSRHLASASSRRLSRESNGQRPGNAMRITKPSSASNSPQSSILQARRRTMVADGFHGRLQPPTFEASYLPTPAPEYHSEIFNDMKRTTRPVSWHPSSHHLPQLQPQPQSQPQPLPRPQQQQQITQYPFPKYNDSDCFASYLDMPPTPAAYSGYTSPASAFSPLSLPYSNFESRNLEPQSYYPSGHWALSAQAVPALDSTTSSSSGSAEPPSAITIPAQPSSQGSSLDWDTFASQGFDRCSAPPTPENVVQPLPQQNAKLAPEEAIPFEPLEAEDNESEGEILYGMGLYDAPEREVVDEQWRFHRSTVLSLLGGVPSSPEPTGRGLKLEDAWEPPVSDDDDEDDANGEEQDSDDYDDDDDDDDDD